jgi:hypothetical protein
LFNPSMGGGNVEPSGREYGTMCHLHGAFVPFGANSNH